MIPNPGPTAGQPGRTRRVPLLAKFGIGVVLLVLGWAILFPSCRTKTVTTEQCMACFAVRRTVETGLWAWDHRVFGASPTTVEEVAGGMDLGALGGESHRHQWRFAGMTFSFLGVRSGVACATPAFNPLALVIRNDLDARARIEERVAAGAFRPEEVLAILELPPEPTGEEAADPGRIHLYHRGQDLLRAVGVAEARRWPGVDATEHPAECPCRRER